MIKAYSYLRLSNKRQMKGDGERRQLEPAEAYASAYNLDLDTSLRDLGVSAFSGANREKGALATFLQMVRQGQIPRGSFLLVESLDRLSRDHVLSALRIFTEIIDAGVTLVTLQDMYVYSSESIKQNWTQLVISLAIMSRAHEESTMKAARLRAAWAKKREGTKKLTSRAPSWLELSEDRMTFSIIEERAAVIRLIFQMLAEGYGCNAVAQRLNADGVRPLMHGKHWHSSTVIKIARSTTVLGHYSPGSIQHVEEDGMKVGRRVPEGPVRTDYYPAIIDEELWDRVQKALDGRSTHTKPKGFGRRGQSVNNLFTGLIRCATCSRSLVYKANGQGWSTKLRCSGGVAGLCEKPVTIQYKDFEKGFLHFVEEADFNVQVTDESAAITRSIETKEVAQAKLKKRIDGLLDLAEEGDDVRDRLRQRRAELSAIDAELQDLRDAFKRAQAPVTPAERAKRIVDLRTQMMGPDALGVRMRMAATIGELVSGMYAHLDGSVLVMLEPGLGYWMEPGFKTAFKHDDRGLNPPSTPIEKYRIRLSERLVRAQF